MPEPYIPLVPQTLVAGRVAAIPKGPWNSTTEYKRLDIVSHDYRAYMAKRTSTNHEPIGEDDDYWMLLVESFIEDFVGATASTNGHQGMVPKPLAGDENKVLRGDGAWGPKLEMDVVKQGDLYGYINSLGDFVAFQSQQDVINIITELLVPEDAKESLDTLKEIADWIQDHPDDAAAMNARITDLENNKYDKTGGQISGNVKITGDLEVNGDVKFDNPLEIESGGTGADNALDARINLNALNNENVAPVENGDTAKHPYEVGDYFIKDDVLYLVISPIAVGDEFSIGDSSITNNVLIIDQGTGSTIVIPTDSSSDDSSSDSSDEDDTPVVPATLTIKGVGKNVIFTGNDDGDEHIYQICVNLLDNSSVKRNVSYAFTSESSYSDSTITITPKFMLYSDDELVDIVSVLNLTGHDDVNIVKPVYIYSIYGEVDLSLSPEVHVLSGFYNCILGDNIEDQIKILKTRGVDMLGATDTTDGRTGYVPAPKAGDNKKVFKGDGTYDKVNANDEIKGALPVANGGTGADNPTGAVDNLDAVPAEMVTNKEKTNKASKAYAVNDQVIIGTTLYKVTQSIAKDDTFEVGVNIELAESLIKQMRSIAVVGTEFVGATSEADGEKGLVPEPKAGDEEKVLLGKGIWDSMSKNFVGTIGEWNALTTAQKIRFDTADILPEFVLTIEKDSHVDTVTLDPASTGNSYGYGRVVNVSATPVTGYEIASGTGPHVVTEDATINVTSAIEQLTVTVNTDDHITGYTLSPEPVNGVYDYGTVVTVTATASEHYHVASGTGTYTITGATTINLASAIDQFTVTVSKDEGIAEVRFAPAATGNVYDYGTEITAIITPKPGYDIISGTGTYTITQDTTVTVTSQIQTYTLTVTQDEHVSAYTLSPEPTDGKYDYGTVVTISATTDEHYHITAGTGEHTITGATTINLTSAIDQFTVTISKDLGTDTVTLSPASTGNVYDYGTTITASATPVTGYDIISGTGEYTITEDTTITVVSEIRHLAFTVTKDEHVDTVTLSPLPTDGKYDYGTVVTVTATPVTGYDIISGTGTYTITEATTVSVTSEIQHLAFTVTKDEHVDTVTLSPLPTDGKYDYGTVVTVTATPVTGYDIISGTGEYTVTADTAITITSEIQHLAFTVTKDEHVDTVTLSPEPTDGKYDYGTVVTVTATTDEHYHLTAGTGTYTVTAATSINITSAIDQFTLTVNKDSHVDTVTLSPEPTDGKYDYSTVVTVTATALSGYEITSGLDDYTITEDTTVNITSNYAPVGLTSDSAFILSVAEPGWDGAIEYSTDGETWTEWDGSEISASANDTVFLRGSDNTKIYDGAYDNRLIFTGKSCIGNIEMLLDYEDVLAGDHPTMSAGCFHSLFEGCTTLVNAPMLPATTLAEDCYYSMFAGCTSLAVAPALPATIMADYCYAYMFDSCTSLTVAPELPAMTLAEGCYDSMFVNCTALHTLPALPATILAEDCYEEMFLNCTSVKLSKTEIGDYKYLYRIPVNNAGTNVGSLRRMFYNTGGTFTGTPSINIPYYTTYKPIDDDEFTVTVVKDEGVDTVTLSPEATNGKYAYATVVTATGTPKAGHGISSGNGNYIILEDTIISITSFEYADYTGSDDGSEDGSED